MNADDLTVKLYAELRKHPRDAREFIRGMLEQMSDAELAEIVGAANEGIMKDRVKLRLVAAEAGVIRRYPAPLG